MKGGSAGRLERDSVETQWNPFLKISYFMKGGSAGRLLGGGTERRKGGRLAHTPWYTALVLQGLVHCLSTPGTGTLP
jgi:hypothetical protein